LTENGIHMVRIKKIISECERIKTFVFNIKNTALFQKATFPIPGQFIMVWVPGIDEIPMSLSGDNKEGDWSITVKSVGDCTKALHNLKHGDYLGIRGPLGTGFTFPEVNIHNIFIIGGGVGIAPLKWLSIELQKYNKNLTIIIGAKRRDELVFFEEIGAFEKSESNIVYCTDDGSFGANDFASNAFGKILKDYSKHELSKSMVFTCGPERMMFKIFQICEQNNITIQASLERIMRCGCGLCGLCALDPLGLLVCKDGPVFNSEQLRKIEDFGHYSRDFTGKKVPLD
jgi:dihydroorotate dehydrogenase electron transfer subunit